MKTVHLILLLCVLLAGCGGGIVKTIAPKAPDAISMLASDWLFMEGANNPTPVQEQVGAAGFDMPLAPARLGYFVTPAHLTTMPQALSLTFKVTASADVVYNAVIPGAANPDTNPAKFSLYLERRNDNMADAAKADYRQWADLTYVFGSADNQTINFVVPLTAEHWSGALGAHTGLAATLGDLAYVGLTFGGKSFAGHGVQLLKGTARLILYDYHFVY